jgi:glutathione S-transferase/GST-like protein
MLELYHCDPNANSGKPMMALKEKGVEFVSHYVNLPRFEQHSPEYLAINPKGQAPTLVHDGVVITESTLMCEYIDEAFDGPPLRPADSRERWRMRVWNKYMDEEFGPSFSMIAWSRFLGPMHRNQDPAHITALLERIPTEERRRTWRTAIFDLFPQDALPESLRRLREGSELLETRLAHSTWLAGDSFSLADIVAFTMAGAMPLLFDEIMNPQLTPHCMEWLERVRDRPGIQAALAMDRGALRDAGRPPVTNEL